MNAAMDAFTNHQMLRGANAMRVCASKKAKLRLDERALQARPDMSKAKLQSLIMQGKVKVDATRVTKAGTRVSEHSSISVDDSAEKYVNRASHKLLTALDHFGVLVYNRAALDSGLSTGGFTDVLLQRGASCVYGIDSGRCQVHERIASDTRVHVMERTNLRHLQPHQLNQPVQLATLDLSFISVLKVLPAVHQVLDGTRGADIIVLIKPQFEARREQVGSGGVVRNGAVHEEVLQRIVAAAESEYGLHWRGSIESPVRGGTKSNTELLAHFVLPVHER